MSLIYPVGFFGTRKKGLTTAASVASAIGSTSFSAPLGAAGSDLYVCVVFVEDNGNANTISVGGVALTKLAQFSAGGPGGTTDVLSFWGGIVSAGGSQTVSIPGVGAFNMSEVYVVRGSPTIALDVSAGGSGSSYSVDVKAGGVVIAGSAGTGPSLTGVTNGTSQKFDTLSNVYARNGYANLAAANPAYAVSLSGGSILGLVSLQP